MNPRTLPRLHPRTGEPLVPVGWSRRGPIWPVLGASPDDASNGDQGGDAGDDKGDQGNGEGDAGGAGSTPPADADSGDKGDQGAGGTGDQGTGSDAPKTYDEKYVKGLRDEAARHRQGKTAAEKRVDDVLAALRNLVDPDAAEAEKDPAKLAQRAVSERDAAIAERNAARLEAAAGRAARSLDVDEVALLDSRGFLGELSKIDPTGDGFADAVRAAAEAAAEKNPRLRIAKATPPPPPSSSDMTGGGETGKGKSAGTGNKIDDIRKARRSRRGY
jgi:hypothetical protein